MCVTRLSEIQKSAHSFPALTRTPNVLLAAPLRRDPNTGATTIKSARSQAGHKAVCRALLRSCKTDEPTPAALTLQGRASLCTARGGTAWHASPFLPWAIPPHRGAGRLPIETTTAESQAVPTTTRNPATRRSRACHADRAVNIPAPGRAARALGTLVL